MMIDRDPPRRVENSGSEYHNRTPGQHWPGFFVRIARSEPQISSPYSSTGGRFRQDGIVASWHHGIEYKLVEPWAGIFLFSG